MRTREEMTRIFDANGGVTVEKRIYNPCGLLCTEYTLTCKGHKTVAHNTQAEVDLACDALCDMLEGI